MKENIAVIFGGKSAEHDISIITALQTISNVDREKYNVIPIYLSKENEFFVGENLCFLDCFLPFLKENFVKISFISGDNHIFASKKTKKIYFNGEKGVHKTSNNKTRKTARNTKKLFRIAKIDCVINCCHGKFGEDGSLSGLLSLSNIPQTSSEILSSASCMDKEFMKKLLISSGIETPKFVSFLKNEFILDEENVVKNIENSLSYPLFVKPASLGSSIGISKVKTRDELIVAIDVALNYDNKIVVEESVENMIEINCAVLGGAGYFTASNVEFPKTKSSFLTFDEKYIQRNDASTGENKKKLNKIPKKVEEDVKKLAIKAFKVFNCKGVVRIDFLFDKNEKKLYLNELNTVPGSLAFYLFKDKYTFKELLNELIKIAIKKQSEDEKLCATFNSNALNNFNNSLKQHK